VLDRDRAGSDKQPGQGEPVEELDNSQMQRRDPARDQDQLGAAQGQAQPHTGGGRNAADAQERVGTVQGTGEKRRGAEG